MNTLNMFVYVLGFSMFISNLSPFFLAMYLLCISQHTERPPLSCMCLLDLLRNPAPLPVV